MIKSCHDIVLREIFLHDDEIQVEPFLIRVTPSPPFESGAINESAAPGHGRPKSDEQASRSESRARRPGRVAMGATSAAARAVTCDFSWRRCYQAGADGNCTRWSMPTVTSSAVNLHQGDSTGPGPGAPATRTLCPASCDRRHARPTRCWQEAGVRR